MTFVFPQVCNKLTSLFGSPWIDLAKIFNFPLWWILIQDDHEAESQDAYLKAYQWDRFNADASAGLVTTIMLMRKDSQQLRAKCEELEGRCAQLETNPVSNEKTTSRFFYFKNKLYILYKYIHICVYVYIYIFFFIIYTYLYTFFNVHRQHRRISFVIQKHSDFQ